MCVCTTNVPGAFGDQKAMDSLNLEPWMVMSYHLGTADQTQVLCKNKYSNPLSPTPVPVNFLMNFLALSTLLWQRIRG